MNYSIVGADFEAKIISTFVPRSFSNFSRIPFGMLQRGVKMPAVATGANVNPSCNENTKKTIVRSPLYSTYFESAL